MDLLITQGRTVLSRPGDALVCADLEKKAQFLVKELIVVPEVEAEERIGFGERTAPGDNFGTSFRDKVEGCELLKDPHRIGGTQNRDGARKPDLFRAGRGGREQNDRSRVEKLLAVMLPDAEDIEANLVRRLNFLQQIPKAHDGIDLLPRHRVRHRGDEAIEPDLHHAPATSSPRCFPGTR